VAMLSLLVVFFSGGIVSAAGNAISSNVITGNIRASSAISATGTVTGGNFVTAGLISATSTINAVGNITGGNLRTAGNITGNYLIGDGSLLTNLNAGNLVGAYSNANVASYFDSGTFSGEMLSTGNLSLTGSAQLGNMRTSGLISATGTATLGNILTAGFISAAGDISVGGGVSALGNITASRFFTSGLFSVAGNISRVVMY
jgi:MSHA biogenesis protein MshQ